MSGLGASRAEPMLKAAGAEMIPALCRCMKRLHRGGSAIEAANLTHESAGQERRHIDALKLIVQPTGRAMNVQEEGLHAGRGAGNRGFQSEQVLTK